MSFRRISKARIAGMAAAAVLAASYCQITANAGAAQAAKAATVWDGVFSKDQAARGQAKYTQVCSNCHQGDLTGSDQAPSLAGGDFLDRWDGQSVGDLADRIRTSMPLDDVGSLNVQLSADLTAFLLQANNFPAGMDELKAVGVTSVDNQLKTPTTTKTSAATHDTLAKTEEVGSDSWITTKVKSGILASSLTQGFDVNVKTTHGVVVLRGALANQAAVDNVKDIAGKVEGVKSVNASALKVAS